MQVVATSSLPRRVVNASNLLPAFSQRAKTPAPKFGMDSSMMVGGIGAAILACVGLAQIIHIEALGWLISDKLAHRKSCKKLALYKGVISRLNYKEVSKLPQTERQWVYQTEQMFHGHKGHLKGSVDAAALTPWVNTVGSVVAKDVLEGHLLMGLLCLQEPAPVTYKGLLDWKAHQKTADQAINHFRLAAAIGETLYPAQGDTASVARLYEWLGDACVSCTSRRFTGLKEARESYQKALSFDKTSSELKTKLHNAGGPIDTPKYKKSGAITKPSLLLIEVGKDILLTVVSTTSPLASPEILPTTSDIGNAVELSSVEQRFLKILPQIQTGSAAPLNIQMITQFIEARMDKHNAVHNRPSGHHPNEAELMLMLNHMPGLTGMHVSHITRAITSIDQWIKYEIPELSESVTRLWGRIGALSHSFRFWRYDAIGGENSLFAKFGFQPVAPRETDKIFGKGFKLQKNNGTLIEFRRGYLLASNPTHGTLVIRNSSPVFGRDLLPHPAYYMPQGLSENELATFNPASDQRLNGILKPQMMQLGYYDKKIPTLTEELLAVKKDYCQWKLDVDVSAFENHQFVGHLKSPGFREVIRLLENKMAEHDLGISQKPLPALAFVHQEYPPFSSYRFKDSLDMEQEHFEITPKRLEELRDMVENRWDSNKYADSDWVRFLQAGIAENAELILVSPEQPAASS